MMKKFILKPNHSLSFIRDRISIRHVCIWGRSGFGRFDAGCNGGFYLEKHSHCPNCKKPTVITPF